MERAVALKKLSKLLGKKFAYRVDNKAPSKDERAAAKSAIGQAIEEQEKLQSLCFHKRDAILAADAEYQKLEAANNAARRRVKKLSETMRRHKITVGTDEGLYFLVKASGDSWEDVISKVDSKQ